MSKREDLLKTYNKIKLLTLSTPKVQKQLIANGNRELIDCICEGCDNILKRQGRPLTINEKSKLCRHKEKLRTLVKKKVSLKEKKRIIQTGGFLGAILAPVASILGSLLFK